jgi:excisionase family DNA binding protein
MPSDTIVATPVDPSVIGPLLTTMEVAKLLRVSQRTVQDWIREGALPAVRYGKLVRVRQADLAAFGEPVSKGAPAARADAPPEEAPAGAGPAPRT